MPLYTFVARAAVPPGQVERFDLYFPGDVNQAMQFAKTNKLGGNIRYKVYGVQDNHPQPILLAVQRNMGYPETGQQPQLSAQHVHGGMPVGPPMGQPNQNRQSGPVDPHGHFQQLGDADLAAGGDSMFGGVDHGTFSDIVLEPNGPQEIPRQI